MKFQPFYFVVFSLLLLAVTASKGRRQRGGRLRCGFIVSECVPAWNGKCPKVPFCPRNVPRVLTNEGCCCSEPSVTQVVSDPESPLATTKAKILNETLENIEKFYLQARLNIDALPKSEKSKLTLEIIDKASKSVSDMMSIGMTKLADLFDLEYFEVLPQVFGDEEAEKSEKGQEIVEEMKEIYEKGESIFGIFQKLSDDLNE